MKPVIFDRHFEKSYAKRILRDTKLSKQFDERYALFVEGVRDNPLCDHALTGSMKGKRSFSVGDDIRVIYLEAPEAYLFLDIGTHNQVYS